MQVVGKSRIVQAGIWEEGGGHTHTGSAVVVADPEGYPKEAVEISTTGNLACGKHALILVDEGDVIVQVKRHRDKIAIRVERITKINSEGIETVECGDMICFDAIKSAINKSFDYHCCKPYYIKNKERKLN